MALFLAHDNILHNKQGAKWKTLLLCKKQAIYYLVISFDRQHLEGDLLYMQHTVLNDSWNYHKLGETDADLWSQFHPE